MTLFPNLKHARAAVHAHAVLWGKSSVTSYTQIFISKAVKTRKTVWNLDNKFVKVLASGKHLIFYSYDGCYL